MICVVFGPLSLSQPGSANNYTRGISITRSHGSARVLYGRRWKSMGEGQIWPPATQNPLNRWSPKFVYVTASGISTTVQNFIQIGLGVSVLRMRDFAPLGTKWLGYYLGGGPWERLQRRRVHRFWRKMRQTTWFRARKCLRLRPPFSPKTAIFGPHFWHFFGRKRL